MSVAPGSSIGSFSVLYIALIYMSLEINLAYTLPRHPPPPPPPLRPPPSPSGLGLHLSFPRRSSEDAGGRGAPQQLPQLSGCGGACPPGPRWALSPGAAAAAAAGRAGRDRGADSCRGGEGGDTAGGALLGHGVPARGSPGSAARGALTAHAGAGQGEGMEGHLRDEHGLVFAVWKRRTGIRPPKTLWRHGLLLREIPGYLGKQLKPVPHHL
ncbi:uncharacterized protein ACIBXB_011345 [Morphnus guianensis]